MPETPNPKSRQPLAPPTRVAHSGYAYAELDVTSNFSFLRGASHPDELVYSAAEMGYRAIALTDRNTLAGVVRAHAAAKSCGMKLLVGSRLTVRDGPELLVWAPDRDSYGRLCRLLTLGKKRVEKGEFQLSVEEFVAQSEGLIVAVDGTEEMKCELVETKRRRDEETKCALVETERRRDGETKCAEHKHFVSSSLRLSVSSSLSTLRDALGDRLSLAVSQLYGGDDVSHLRRLL